MTQRCNAQLLTRRTVLVAGMASAGTLLGGCTTDGPADIRSDGRTALLLPLTGKAAGLGQNMADAASIGNVAGAFSKEIVIYDAGDSVESASAAAVRARDAGVKMILGPLFGKQAKGVAAAVGSRIPVVSFTNDASLAGGGVFVFGVTPQHSAQAVLSFAFQRGLRSIGMVVPEGVFGQRSSAAARQLAGVIGVTLHTPVVGSGADVVGRITAAAGGKLPDAVYIPTLKGGFGPVAAKFRRLGVQVLGSVDWAASDPTRVKGLSGSWFAAPDPSRFEAFARTMETQFDQSAGIVAGLTYDAVEMARLLGRSGRQTRSGITRAEGFSGVLGPFKFQRNGLCQRGLSILQVDNTALNLIGSIGV